MATLSDVPNDLVAPVDDGACDHLTGMKLPDLSLPSTQGGEVGLSALSGRTVIYIYPMTGRPDTPLPTGWEQIPGAMGCTPQACSFRDHHAVLKAHQTSVYGISTQSTAYQEEAAERLQLHFPLLSDEALVFAKAMSLPTMDVEGKVLIKRMALICRDSTIEKVFYPVFPPGQNAAMVLEWLEGEGP